MPTQHLAHDALTLGLNYTEKIVDWTKSKPGMVRSLVERVEGPVCATLESRAAKSVLKVGDSVLTSVDGHLDNALNSRYYKGGEAFVKSTYSNRIVPATNTVTTTTSRVTGAVVTTTKSVTTPVVNVYTTALTFADRQVESYLPDAEASDRHAPLSLTGVTAKATRRAVRKVGAVKTGMVMRAKRTSKSVRSAVSMAFEQARPSNLKKTAKAAYANTLSTTDKLIDSYLPGAMDDGLVVKGPVTLVTKLTKRTTKHTIASVKAAALAVRNSPATFKKAIRNAAAAVRAQAARIANMGISIRYQAANTLTPYLEAATTRALAVARATDAVLLQRPATAGLRNFAVAKYNMILAPMVSKYLPVLVAPAPTEAKPVAAKLSFAAAAPAHVADTPKTEDSPMSVESESSEATGEQEEEAQVPRKRGARKKKAPKKAELSPAAAAEKDEDAYC